MTRQRIEPLLLDSMRPARTNGSSVAWSWASVASVVASAVRHARPLRSGLLPETAHDHDDRRDEPQRHDEAICPHVPAGHEPRERLDGERDDDREEPPLPRHARLG